MDVPIVLVFTKADENRDIIRNESGLEGFIKRRLPALARTVKRAAMFQVSAVQVTIHSNGDRTPNPDSTPWQVEKPLRYCLDKINLQREIERQREFVLEQQRSREAQERDEERAARRKNRTLVIVVVSMLVVAACVIALAWAFKS